MDATDSDRTRDFEKLKKLLLQPAPIWINGVDFDAFNFGDETQNYSEAGRDSLVRSGVSSAVICRKTGKWRFGAPGMRFTNVSHVPDYEKAKINLTFVEMREMIEDQ